MEAVKVYNPDWEGPSIEDVEPLVKKELRCKGKETLVEIAEGWAKEIFESCKEDELLEIFDRFIDKGDSYDFVNYIYEYDIMYASEA